MIRRRGTPPEPAGPARIGRRTKDLVKRLDVGDVAIIDHRDLDRVAAEGLVSARAAVVVNAAESITGRYPNSGPRVLARAGIPLVDNVGLEVLDAVRDGDPLRIDGGEVWRGGELVAKGSRLELGDIETAMEQARRGIGGELRRFADNTLEYVRREADLTFLPLELPPLRTSFRKRHALVVVRGHDYRSDLKALRSYIREFRPVLIGVDGGADALLELGFNPDVIIGDFDSVSEPALHCGADLVHHVHPDGRAPGRENLVAWGVPYEEFVADGTSEDVAMLMAYEGGAELIVAVGTHATMIEFLDKGRAGMSSTFLTRLRLGPMLVDAKGVSRLYEARIRRRDIVLLVGAALVGILTISIVSEPIHVFFDGFRVVLEDLWRSIT
ncbi:MAG: putative cytokinetic ring protein SteA [Acidimicrobiia bacterium]